MASDLNQCNFIGRLGADPETRYTGSGMAVSNFNLAVGHKYKDQEHTEWVRCVTFGKLAEIVEKYLQKGKQVFVSGRMQTDKWTGKDGADRYTTKVIIEQMQMLGAKGDVAQPQGDGGFGGGGFRQTPEEKKTKSEEKAEGQSDDFFDDDIPF